MKFQKLRAVAHIFTKLIPTPFSLIVPPSAQTDHWFRSTHGTGLPMTCMAVKLSSFPLARARLNPIARAWLGAGYTAFGVWAHDVAIEYWPAGTAPPPPDVAADVPGAFPGIRIGLVGSPTPWCGRAAEG